MDYEGSIRYLFSIIYYFENDNTKLVMPYIQYTSEVLAIQIIQLKLSI